MVNKAVIGVIGVILITTLGVGALVGLQGGGGNADDANSGNGGGGTGTPAATATMTPNGTMGNGTGGNGTVATLTPAPEERTPIPAREFNRNEIERNVTQAINEWRRSEGLDPLDRRGTTAERIAAMARDHSNAMADEGSVSHVIDGVDVADRYENHDLYDACQYQTSAGYIAQPGGGNKQFEHITSTVAGGQYETENGTQFNEDDEAVSNAIVREFKRQSGQEDGMLAPNMGKMGVGVEITRTGGVYATVHICGQ